MISTCTGQSGNTRLVDKHSELKDKMYYLAMHYHISYDLTGDPHSPKKSDPFDLDIWMDLIGGRRGRAREQ